MGTTDRPGVATADDLLAYVRRVPAVATLLVALPRGRVEASNEAARRLLELSVDELEGVSLSSVARELWRSEPMRLVVSGTQSGFSGPVPLRLPGGQLAPSIVSARTTRIGSRRWVLLAIDGRGDAPVAFHRTTDEADVIFGVGDGAARIGDVSPNVADVLGYPADTFIGTVITDVLHEDDFAAFVNLSSGVVSSRRPGSLRMRVRHVDGTWLPFRIFVAPLHAHPKRALAFALVRDPADVEVPPSTAPPSDARLEEVEQRLRRIALELAALGIADATPAGLSADVAATFGRLSPKRQEIVTRLRGGARVPTVAREMYLSPSTVRNHLSAVFREFGVSSQEELLRLLHGTD